jgi:hypothetical protein
MSLLDGIVNAILGPDTSQMTEEDRRKAEAQGSSIARKLRSRPWMHERIRAISSWMGRRSPAIMESWESNRHHR